MRRIGSSLTHSLFISVMLLVLITSYCFASVICVKPNGNDSNDGKSWIKAKATIQNGIDTAQSGDEVWVIKGTYTENIILKDGVSVLGGFTGSEYRTSQRRINPKSTIIDGNLSGSVVTVPGGCGPDTVIDGFTIRNGSGTFVIRDVDDEQAILDCLGGGIYCHKSSPTISNNIITDNSAKTAEEAYWGSALGGGIFFEDGSPVIRNNTIKSNSCYKFGEALGEGGGIYCRDATGTIKNNDIYSNYSVEEGGGIYIYNSSVTVSRNEIHDNRAMFAGAGINVCTYGDYEVSITDNTITENVCDELLGYASSGSGGGIYALGNNIEISDNDISRNVSRYQGGGIDAEGVAILIANNRIDGNVSHYDDFTSRGGGLIVVGDAIVANNLVSNNRSYYGGGIAVLDTAVSLINNTLVGNSTEAGGEGGGLYIADSIPTVVNNIIAYGTSGVYCTNGSGYLRNNDLYRNGVYDYSGIDAGEGDLASDPLFNNQKWGDYRLRQGSACINAGFDDVVQPDWRDYYGLGRIYGTHVDIGASEWRSTRFHR